jgi:hypothetical protein
VDKADAFRSYPHKRHVVNLAGCDCEQIWRAVLWESVPLVYTHQGDYIERQTGNHLLLQPGEKVIQPVGLLSGFAHHAFIARQDIDLLFLKQGLSKKLPEHLRPGNGRVEKSLDGAVAGTFSRPSR